MPSLEHELPLLLLRHAPELVPRLMQDSLHVAFPVHAQLRTESEELGEVAPSVRQADLVLTARDAAGAAVAAVVVEVQRRADEDKQWVWPQYVASLHARSRCLTWLLVLTDDDRVGTWARRTIPTFHPNPGFAPLVLAPADVPSIAGEDEARACPELAVLSALFHRKAANAEEITRAALAATAPLDAPRSDLYFDLIFAALPQVAARALEGLMETGKYEYRSEFARKYFAQGREEGLEEARALMRNNIAAMLAGRGLPLTTEARTRLESERELEVLNSWIARATTVASLEDLFDGGQPT